MFSPDLEDHYFEAHDDTCHIIGFSGELLVTAGYDNRVRVWRDCEMIWEINDVEVSAL